MTRGIIGIMSSTGPRSGKSTVGKIIKERLESLPATTVERIALAHPVKKISASLMRSIFEINNPAKMKKTDYIGFKEDSIPISVRDLFIAVGMAGRTVSPNIWIDMVIKEQESYQHPSSIKNVYFIVDDIRFKNEINRFKVAGGSVD